MNHEDENSNDDVYSLRRRRQRFAAETSRWLNPTSFDSTAPPFAIGRPTPRRFRSHHERRRQNNYTPGTATAMATNGPFVFDPTPWTTRCQTPPEPGRIRMLSDPDTAPSSHVTAWWWRDRTLTEWVKDIEQTECDISNNPLMRAVYPPTYAHDVTAVFYMNQRSRWLARVVIQRLRLRIWARRPACNVDLIDLQPVPDADAIMITDTTNKRIFRFHRRDLLNTVMSNLTMSDEYLPTPRHPTNPWTNERFTKAQTMAVCHRLAADFVKRGRCPPPLLSSFWDAHFNIKQFLAQNTAALSQQAIRTYFRELTDDNIQTVYETMTNLLSDAGVDFSPLTVRRWLYATPRTPVHQAWVAFCRDYTLYLNLHIQVRPTWYDTGNIYRDVRTLYANTPIREPAMSTRRRVIQGQTQTPTHQPHPLFSFSLLPPLPAPETPLFSLLTSPLEPSPAPLHNVDALFDLVTDSEVNGIRGLLGLMLQPPPLPTQQPPTTAAADISGNQTTVMSIEDAIQIIQNSMFR